MARSQRIGFGKETAEAVDCSYAEILDTEVCQQLRSTEEVPVVMKRMAKAFAATALLLAAAPARADEVFAGLYAHDADLVTRSGIESGADFELGWRGERMRFLRAVGSPSPYAFASVNSAGDTHFAAAGVSWKLGNPFYVRPGIGIAVHTGPGQFDPSNARIYFGSRILFEPEIGVGYQVSDRVSVEASWVHLSHATLFSGQNPGLDTIGARINYRFR
jgi:lipid A 3-O-deacylase